MNKQLWKADKGCSSSLGKRLTTLHHKKPAYYEMLHRPWT